MKCSSPRASVVSLFLFLFSFHNQPLQLVFDGGSCPQGSEAEQQVLTSALALVQSQKDRLESLGVRQVR